MQNTNKKLSSREFKFRAWDTKLEMMLPWNYPIRFDDPEYIVQQFTGLRDKNDREIYEGDILDWGDGIADEVYCYNGCFWASKIRLHEDAEYGLIVGNIFENPELLTEQ